MEKLIKKEGISSRYKLLIYFSAIVLCALILVATLQLWRADFSVPFSYEGDGLSNCEFIKGMIDNGNILDNKFIGVPSSLNIAENPSSDWLHIFIVKIISIITNDYAKTINYYFLLTFPLTTITALMVFLRFKLKPFFSIIGSLLYTFLPYHFLRGENHIFLSAYYMVPLAAMLVLLIFSEENLLFKGKEDNTKKINKKFILYLIICLLIAISGVYYAFFTCFFLLVVGVIMSIREKDAKKIVVSGIFIITITFGSVLSVMPNIIYTHNSGTNTSKISRLPIESEIYGLKITQLLLPATGHRIDFLEKKKDVYNTIAPLTNENDTATLGFIGSMGFIISLGYVFLSKNQNKFKDIGFLNLSAILLATTGGLSTFVSFFLTSMIRSYNRISVFIAFFSIFLMVSLVTNGYKKYKHKYKIKVLFYTLGVIILCVGILDQTNERYIPDYSKINKEYQSDERFVNHIQSKVPSGTKIFQLPYIPFPEVPSPNKMEYYALFRPYLHSENLYWSYGSIKGKESDAWQRTVSEMKPYEFINEIYKQGFRGVYLDSYGYENQEELNKTVDSISYIVGEKPIYSENSRLIFIGLNKFIASEYKSEN